MPPVVGQDFMSATIGTAVSLNFDVAIKMVLGNSGFLGAIEA